MTAVEFIRQEFLEKITNENYKKSFDQIIEQAKQMEKEQMINFGFKIAEEANNLIEPTVEPYEKSEIEERFYNEIFKSE